MDNNKVSFGEKRVSNGLAALYLVATPIGNLEDMSQRAVRILKEVDIVLAEDTRRTKQLLNHLGITKEVTSFYEHNEQAKSGWVIDQLKRGRSMALVSDAGTPLINDPGYILVRQCHEEGLTVVPIPGPCAAITALSASGLPTNRFVFLGYPPAKAGARKQYYKDNISETGTLIFYESPHRIKASLGDMIEIFGQEREATLARELTKRYETIRRSSLLELLDWVEQDPDQQKGEFVLLVHGSELKLDESLETARRSLVVLLPELPLKQAVNLTSKLSGAAKNIVYDMALALQAEREQS